MTEEELKEENRMEVKVLGRVLGTADGWDGDLGEYMVFYDFKPLPGIDLEEGDMQIDFDKDLIGVIDEKADFIGGGKPLVEFLSTIKREEES